MCFRDPNSLQVVECPNCGCKNPSTSTYCRECEAELPEFDEAAAAAAAPAPGAPTAPGVPAPGTPAPGAPAPGVPAPGQPLQ